MGVSDKEERARIDSNIREYGCHILTIAEDDVGPGFSYTIGLHGRFAHPELIVVGLHDETAQTLLNIAARALMSGGRYEAGKEYDDFLHGYACTFRDMPREKYRDYLGFAIWYYGGYDFPAMQLIYPDRYHRWPWEEGVHEEFRRRQPVIDMAQGA